MIRRIGNQEWNQLTDDERLDHLAFDHYRQIHIQQVINTLTEERPKPTPEELKARHTTSSWEPGAAATLLLGMVE